MKTYPTRQYPSRAYPVRAVGATVRVRSIRIEYAAVASSWSHFHSLRFYGDGGDRETASNAMQGELRRSDFTIASKSVTTLSSLEVGDVVFGEYLQPYQTNTSAWIVIAYAGNARNISKLTFTARDSHDPLSVDRVLITYSDGRTRDIAGPGRVRGDTVVDL